MSTAPSADVHATRDLSVGPALWYWPFMSRPLVIFVDVDDTLVRSQGTKRIPMSPVIAHVRALHEQGAQLYCWSSGGGEYAKESAVECGLADCFLAFLPKPEILLDDRSLDEWRRLVAIHPNTCPSMTLDDYRARLSPG